MDASGSAKRTRSSPLGSIVELVLIVAIAVGLAFGIQAFIVKPYRIPSGSMEPTLEVGQRVLVNRIGHVFSPPSVGDVVVFNPPAAFASGCANPRQGIDAGRPRAQMCAVMRGPRSQETFIKRVVAGPGDTVALRKGRVVLNGELQREPYVRACEEPSRCDFPRPITIPPGQYFMLGDNRGASDDSRFWGPVPDDWIIGGAFATYWPPDRIGLL